MPRLSSLVSYNTNSRVPLVFRQLLKKPCDHWLPSAVVHLRVHACRSESRHAPPPCPQQRKNWLQNPLPLPYVKSYFGPTTLDHRYRRLRTPRPWQYCFCMRRRPETETLHAATIVYTYFVQGMNSSSDRLQFLKKKKLGIV